MDILQAFATLAKPSGYQGLLPCVVSINQDGGSAIVAGGTLNYAPGLRPPPIERLAQFSGTLTLDQGGPHLPSGEPVPSTVDLTVEAPAPDGTLQVTFREAVHNGMTVSFKAKPVMGGLNGMAQYFVRTVEPGHLNRAEQALYVLTFGSLPPL